jgi:F0F1-type ATP synthase membrane subunit b/b'
MSDQAAYDVETILLRLKEVVETGRSMPMSASVLVNREEFIELLDEAIATLPQELRHARWLLKEREQFLAQARREADDIIEAGRVRAERMVERTEVVREARRVAQNVIDEAEASGRQLRHEAEDYVDQKLAAFEVVLERTMQAVQKGRERLQVVIEPDQMLPGPPGGDTGDFDFTYDAEPTGQQTPPPVEDAEGAFFDQDASY